MSGGGAKYELGARIGGGGMADVYRATLRGAEGFERDVAVKRIKARVSRDERFAAMFVDEARLAASLHHPNIVRTLDFDRDEEGRLYLVMELIDGVDASALRGQGPLDPRAVVHIACELLRALDYAHEREIDGRRVRLVHRDVSPHNIMLGWQGSVQLVDFGIAKAAEVSKVSQSGSIKGKVGYMSPEQLRGEALDGRSDLFSLGVVLHELLSGQRLFTGETQAELITQVVNAPIPTPSTMRPEISDALSTAVMTLLERDRLQRATCANDALQLFLECPECHPRGRDELAALLEHSRKTGSLDDKAETQSASQSPLPPPVTPEPSRSRQPGWGVWAMIALFLAGGGLALYVANDKEAAPVAGVQPTIDASLVDAAAPIVAEGTEDPFMETADAAPPADASLAEAPGPVLPSEEPRGRGKIVIRVKPWAQIKVDGKRRGQSPRTLELPAGKHRIQISNPSLGVKENLRVHLHKGETKTIERDWN